MEVYKPKLWSGNLNGEDQSENLDVDVRIISE
jgi:hypothetical protein